MAQVKKTLKPSDPEVEMRVNEEIKDGELQETFEKVVVENTETEEIAIKQAEVIENNIEETNIVEEYKEGGVIKAQSGTTNNFWADLEKTKKRAEELRNSGFIMEHKDPVVVEEEINEPLDETLYKGRMSAIEDIYKNDPHEKDAATARLNSEYGKTKSTESSNKLGLPFYLREATNFANWLQARKTAKNLKDIGHKTTSVMRRMTLSAPSELSFRYNLPIHNQYDRNIAKLESSANKFNTSDAFLNTAAKLDILDKSAELRNEQARMVSEAVSEQNQLHDQRKEQYNQIRTEIANKNKQIMGQADLARLNADSAYEQEVRKLDDTLMYKYQDLLNRFGKVDSSVKNKAFQYSEQAAAARAVGNETLAKQYDELFKQTQSPGYRNYMLNNIIYGKQGIKLRPTYDMLLLNTQKSVAKAIEKLNDNTMKLILKALS